MFCVEFIGPTGVGKSTIYKKVVQRLKLTDIDRYLTSEEAFMRVSKLKIDKIYRYVIKILPYNLAVRFCSELNNRSLMQSEAQNKFLAKWGKSLESFLRSSTFDNMPINDRMIVISGLMEMGSVYESINNGSLSRETVVFFEEGFVQRSFMFISPLINEEADKQSVFNYLNSIPLPDLIIHVNSNLTSCYERMLARPTGLTHRLRKLEKNEIMDFLKVSDNHLQNVVRCLKKNGAINLFEINNDQDLNRVICDLEQRIKSLFDIDFTV